MSLEPTPQKEALNEGNPTGGTLPPSRPTRDAGSAPPSDSGRQKAVSEAYAETVPPSCRGTYLRATQGKASPRTAIKAKCQECVGFEDMKKQIGGCRAFKCPIWKYRPYQDKESAE